MLCVATYSMTHTYTDQFLLGLLEFFEWSRWLLLLAIVLTVCDLRFGIAASQYRKEAIKRSQAVRRTINKIVSYWLWVIMAYCFGQAFGKSFGIDLLPLALLIIIYGVELESIFVNYFEAKGKRIRINVLNFFKSKMNLFEIEEDEKNNNK